MAEVISIMYCGMGCGKVDTNHFNTCDGRMMRGSQWECGKCKKPVESLGGRDVDCSCGASYNGSGQRLRDDWRDNPSNYDDEIGDLEGYELQHADW